MADGDLERITRHVSAFTAIIARMAHASFEQRLSESDLGVSPVQFGVMRSLCRGHLTISELSRKFVVDPSTLVPVVDSLERKGYVLRGRDPQDRRRVPLSLTEDGQQLLRRSVPVNHDDPFFTAVKAMGHERAEQLSGLLQELLSAMPEGEAIVKEVTNRLDAVAGAEAAMKHGATDVNEESHHEPGHGHELGRLIKRRKMIRKGRA